MMIFKRITVQATVSIACDQESLDYEDKDVIRRLVFDAVREDPASVARMLKIISVATEVDDAAEGYTRLPDWAAEFLSGHAGDSLDLRTLSALSDGAARSLATFNGEALLLDGLTELTDAAAAGLRELEALQMSEKECKTLLTENAVRPIAVVAAAWLKGGSVTQQQYRH